jgi:hypothetical protein
MRCKRKNSSPDVDPTNALRKTRRQQRSALVRDEGMRSLAA